MIAAPPPGTGRPISSAAPTAAEAVNADALAALLEELRRRLEAGKQYPRAARRRGLEGTVVLRAFITPRGAIRRWELAEASTHRILDQAALRTARGIRELRAAGPPLDGSEITVAVPLRYGLRRRETHR